MLSERLRDIVDRLPLRPGLRVLEIGCGTGMMVRDMALRMGEGYVLGIDRSATAIEKAEAIPVEGRRAEIAFRCVAAEAFERLPDEAPFDIAVAVRVGAFDGRFPRLARLALPRLRAALVPSGLFFVDDRPPIQRAALRQPGSTVP